MFRKLRNSLTALALAASALTVGAFVMAAVPFSAPAVAHAAVAVESTATPARPPVVVIAKRKVAHAVRMRHSAAMPYFSFVPRG
ncbi:hypothetical protein [Lysobacter humi (ex Lee et al. 2017)]